MYILSSIRVIFGQIFARILLEHRTVFNDIYVTESFPPANCSSSCTGWKKKKRKNASRPRPGVRGTSRGFYEPRKSWRDCSLRESLPWHGIIHGISSRYSRRYLGQAFGFVKQPLRGINPPFSNHPRFFYKIPPPLPWSFSSSTTI